MILFEDMEISENDGFPRMLGNKHTMTMYQNDKPKLISYKYS